MHEIKIRPSFRDSDLVKNSKALQRVAKEKDTKCCLLCKSKGKALLDSLFQIKPGKPGNANSHLKKMHKDHFDAIQMEKEEKEARRQEQKRKSSSAASGAPPKKMKQAPLPIFPQNNRRAGTTEERKAAVSQFEVKICRFVNGKALADNVVEDPNFRDMIDFSIKHAHLLSDYKHMGRHRYLSIQCKNWTEFNEKVSKLIKDAREYYVNATGRRQAFVSVSHDVWEGKRKEINGLTIYFLDPVSGSYYRIPVALMKPDVSCYRNHFFSDYISFLFI